ncbi:MAG: HoxN/HupN/NixA family nickel/cobalt transporter [Acidimicrobiales bacterium]|nr:HoxN/HupN/NixA family nickel/cobalt transporter [Acidimicrobiales bacterium]
MQGLSPPERRNLCGMGVFIVALHIGGFLLLFLAVHGHYHLSTKQTLGIGTGTLAYTLGMRHAFDADHISAIDNTTRKLMAEGQRPLSVGFWFSLGHSSVVLALSVMLNLGIRALNRGVSKPGSGLHHYTGLIGTSISGAFLYIIAILNLVILVSLLRMFLAMRSGRFDHDELEQQLNARGLMSRFFGPLARRIDVPWKMYPIGFLFGLGFDTATEVALLILSGTALASGLPFWAVLSMPLLFAAGMCLLDTVDGSFMNFAYGWAFSNPVRKIYYNLTITTLSVGVAFVIGSIELLSVLGDQLQLTGGIWDWTAKFDINHAGFLIVGLFVATWVLALGIWRFGRVEARWEEAAASARADQDLEAVM